MGVTIEKTKKEKFQSLTNETIQSLVQEHGLTKEEAILIIEQWIKESKVGKKSLIKK